MPELPIAFLNCYSLLTASMKGRGPRTAAALRRKQQRLATMLRNLGLARSPTFICLCELADPKLGLAVASSAFPGVSYSPVRSHSGKLRANETGLLILYDADSVDELAVQQDRLLRSGRERSRWLGAKFVIKALPQSRLWVIVNHWHSGFHNDFDGVFCRRRASEEISDLFRGTRSLTGPPPKPIVDHRADQVIVLGDFNCDPADNVFHLADEGAWKVSPSIDAVVTAPAIWPCFYNPMVKAPDVFGTFQEDKYGLTVKMVDHILISGTLCKKKGLRYRPSSIAASDALTGASDHAAIGAALVY